MRVISGCARGTILYSIEDKKTRPTLDRVKESLFNIIQKNIENAIILDLFSGSGAIGIEFLSRGAQKAYMCDNSTTAVNMIKKNLEKTKLYDKAVIINKDYIKCLLDINKEKIKFNIIYLDPPYKENMWIKALENINKLELLAKDGILIIETDELEKTIEEIEKDKKINYNIHDIRKYGRVHLIFLNERGK